MQGRNHIFTTIQERLRQPSERQVGMPKYIVKILETATKCMYLFDVFRFVTAFSRHSVTDDEYLKEKKPCIANRKVNYI